MRSTFFVLCLWRVCFVHGAETAQQPSKIEVPKLPSAVFSESTSTPLTKVRISFSGDVIIHEALYKKVVADPRKDFSIIWNKVNPFFAKADLSYANLEGPTALGIDKNRKNKGDIGFVYDGEVYSGTDFLFNYHPQLISDLKKSGIDIVSIANNHSFDRGAVGMNKTIEALKEKKMFYFGARKTESTEDLYTLIRVKDINIAWIACTEMLNGFKDKKAQLLLCYDQSQKVIELIQKVRALKEVDAIIVTPHWGNEYAHEQNEQQIKHAHMFLEAGATAIIGSHPHVLQPIELYKTSDGRETFIAYSLGNFVAYQRDIDRRTSAVIYLDFIRDSDNKVRIANYSYEPITRHYLQIAPARSEKSVIKHVEKYLGVLQDLEPNLQSAGR